MKLAELKPSQWVFGGSFVVALVLGLPKLGDGLKYLAYLTNTPSTAYAAKEQAEATDDKFERYLMQQQAYTQALNDYVAQQQAPTQAVPRSRGLREWSDTEQTFWCCPDDDREECFRHDAWYRCP